MISRADLIAHHYSSFWRGKPTAKRLERGPIRDLPPSFHVLEFPPSSRKLWTYATCEMSQPADEAPIELHLLSPIQTDRHVELLTVIAHYHRTGSLLNLNHTVNFGRPWLPDSSCEFGIISLPYLDGSRLEHFHTGGTHPSVRCLWLIPITKAERDFKIDAGTAALEQKFQAASFNYADPRRQSVV